MSQKRCGCDYRLPTPSAKKEQRLKANKLQMEKLSVQYGGGSRTPHQNHRKTLMGDVDTASHIVHTSEEFVYGGWTRTDKNAAGLEGTASNINGLIPNLGASLKYPNQLDNYGYATTKNNKGQVIDFETAFEDTGDQSFKKTPFNNRDQAKSIILDRLGGEK